uniref:Uncharacterized protein n=1 Tax=Anguilla anguilla TaxID=7936 RepID=A0A0E9TKP2_ANGAN
MYTVLCLGTYGQEQVGMADLWKTVSWTLM